VQEDGRQRAGGQRTSFLRSMGRGPSEEPRRKAGARRRAASTNAIAPSGRVRAASAYSQARDTGRTASVFTLPRIRQQRRRDQQREQRRFEALDSLRRHGATRDVEESARNARDRPACCPESATSPPPRDRCSRLRRRGEGTPRRSHRLRRVRRDGHRIPACRDDTRDQHGPEEIRVSLDALAGVVRPAPALARGSRSSGR
jgi:hypothetical protein